MPTTYITFLLATLAIAGIPPFAGFFSKDEILWNVFASERGSIIVWIIGTIAALFTAFYMFRLVYLTFFGQTRASEEQKHHLHESPWTMTVPLIILGGLSVIGGWIGIPHLLGGDTIPNIFHHFLEPAVTKYGHVDVLPHYHERHATEIILMALSVVVAIIGWFLARTKFRVIKELPDPATYKGMVKVLWNKYWVDEIYEKLIINPLLKLSDVVFLNLMDKKTIDGLANGSAKGWRIVARIGAFFQTGNIQTYSFYMVCGVALAIGFALLIL